MYREDKKSNDLFYVCSLIEYIARKTKNRRNVVVDALGRANIEKIYDLADVLHSDNIDNVVDFYLSRVALPIGTYDNVSEAKYSVPTYWDIGKIYKRLILGIVREKNVTVVDALFMAYHSWITDKVDDYNSSFYYENPDNILCSFLTGVME